MAQKKGQQNQTFNSLDALANLGKPQAEVKPIGLLSDASMNFYSFLHKRNRFFEKDVIIDNRTLKDHERFKLKKITIEDVKESKDNNGRRPRPVQIQLLDSFTKWQKDDFFKAYSLRHLNNAKSICSEIKEQNFKPDWRLAIGLGTGSIFETSMSLHHVHGFPYIPASAIKGIVRSYLIAGVFGMESLPKYEEDFPLINAEFRALTKSKDFCKLFGCPSDISEIEFNSQGQPIKEKKKNGKEGYKSKSYPVALRKKDKVNEGEENQGSIIFFDALPIESPKNKIKADIMNPHYPDYYNDKEAKKAPTDYQNPIPILFLTVEGLHFQFIVGIKKGEESFNIEIGKYKGNALEQVVLMLKNALQEHGIGAKTAVGYGYMNNK